MFKKAKRFSKHFGLKKHDSDSDEEDEHNTEPQFQFTLDRASTHNSTASNLTESNPSSRTLSKTSTINSAAGLGSPLAQLGRSHTSPCFNQSEEDMLARRLSEVSAMDSNNLELLLSMETQARMDAQAEREKNSALKKKKSQEEHLTPRPTRIKFELPTTPPRSRSPSRLAYPRARPVRSLQENELSDNMRRHSVPPKKPKRPHWRHLFSDRDDEESEDLPITFGSRVRLLRRPLPTFGNVKYIGGVHFGKGEWIGIELDHGVGNCDGTIDGKFYFETDHNRGIFCKRHDLEAVAE